MAESKKSAAPATEQQASAKPTRRLGAYGKIDRNATAMKLDDLIAEEVTILGFRVVKGQFGMFAFIDIVRATGEKVAAICGGQFVLDALQDADQRRAFPVQATFTKKGRAWDFE